MKTKVLFFTIVALLASTTAKAYDFTVGGIYYNITDATNKKVEVTYDVQFSASYSGAVTIPAQVSNGGITYSVTDIGIAAFYNCSGVTSVIIPNSVTSIWLGAFEGCSGLTSVTIPNSVTSIGQSVFASCTGLTSVAVSWTTPLAINANVFGGVTTANVCLYVLSPGTNATYSAAAVWSGFNIQSPTFTVGGINYALTSATTVKIDANQFATGAIVIPATVSYGCKSFNVTSIGNNAFYASDIISVTIPNSVTSIGTNAFALCTGLQSVSVSWSTPLAITSFVFGGVTTANVCLYVLSPGTVATYSSAAFWSGFNIQSPTFTVGGINYAVTSANTVKVDVTASATGAINIPATVTDGCKSFNVTSIGDKAFRFCSGLASVTIPNSVTSIGSFAFQLCSGLTSVTIPNSVTTIGDYAFSLCSGLTSVTLPSSVTSIGMSAFDNCSGLASFTIPNSVTSIGNAAFDGCTGLVSVTIPNSITSIGNQVFIRCSGLTSITIPNSVTSIGQNAFDSCTGLTSVTIPNSVTSIGDYAFGGCTGLQSVFVSWATPLTINANVFEGVTTSNAHLYVPAGKEATYDATAVWTDFIISAAPSVYTRVKALLKGPLSGTTMSTTLNTANLIPLAQPYSGAPWNYAGTSTESVTAIPANVTDWVLVELRDATTPTTILATRAAFIKNDGNIVDVDGVSPVEFKNMLVGNYHIAVKHRNHLAIRTATAQALGTTASGATLYDFTTAQTQANGTNPMVKSGTVYAMWSGDVNADGNVYNTATPQDASQVVNGVANKTGNTFHLPSYGGYKNVYNNLDVNMDGNVYNTATPQDASNIVNNVANAPGNTFHLPAYSGLKAKL